MSRNDAPPLECLFARARFQINAEDESDCWTFGELYACSLAVGAFLRARGFGKRGIAAMLAPNCCEWLTIFIGTTAAGGALVGIRELDDDGKLIEATARREKSSVLWR